MQWFLLVFSYNMNKSGFLYSIVRSNDQRVLETFQWAIDITPILVEAYSLLTMFRN